MKKRTTRSVLLASVMGLTLALSACGSSEPTEDAGGGSSAADETTTEEETTTEAAPAGDEPFGEACSAIPADGEGSSAGMADDPVATAASNNPVLSTLVAAVTAANLGDTLNQQEAITVFAPANAAFEALPPGTVEMLTQPENIPMLSSILTYHVIPERLAPDALAGTFPTVNGAELTIEGSGESFTVSDSGANVVCGNVQTANATVYIIDQVLMPPA